MSHRIPPEWAPHKRIWTAWPSAPEFWGAAFDGARMEVAAMARALAESGERVTVLAHGVLPMASARAALASSAEIVPAVFGDIWLRDIGPIFKRDGGALGFEYNGWGGKYVMAGDELVAQFIADRAGAVLERHDFVLEGGALEMDGEGTLLTTRQCVLNPNRTSWTERDAEATLKRALGVEKVLWLDEGLAGDHTDGHIDNIARFVAPGRVVCQSPAGDDDPNADVLAEIALTLSAMHDAQGRELEVIRIPSPGRIEDDEGDPIPASHMNFIIGNNAVVVPVYSDSAEEALAAFEPLFPGRAIIGLPSHALLTGGGSFHCITQQEPA